MAEACHEGLGVQLLAGMERALEWLKDEEVPISRRICGGCTDTIVDY